MADINPSTIPDDFDDRTDEEKKREEERLEASKRLDEKNKVKTNEQDIIDSWDWFSKKDSWSNEQKLAYQKHKEEVDDFLQKEQNNLLTQGQNAIQEGFDPYIHRAWKAPGYDEEKAKLSEQYENIQSRKKSQAQKIKDTKKKIRDEAEAKKQAIIDNARKRQEQAAKEKKENAERAQEERFQDIMSKPNTPAWNWFKAHTKRKPDEKDVDFNITTDLLDLTPEERKSIRDIGKDLLDREKEAIDALKADPAFKAEEDNIKAARDAYWKGVNELSKKQAPYSIRNTFLIIDAIQKSLQNIGRALPQTEYSPAYTKTPFEEPELFKLWREQIEKGQELKEKQLEGYIDILKGNLGALGYDKQFINDFIKTKQGLINDWYKAGLNREQTKAMLNFEIDLGQNLNDLDDESKNFLRTAQLYMAKDMNEALSIVLKDYMIKNPESVTDLMNSLQGLLDSGVKITSELGNVINVLLNGFETQIKRINEIGFGAWFKEIISGTGAAIPGKGDKGKNTMLDEAQKKADEVNPSIVTNNKLSKGLRDTITDAVLSDTNLSDESRQSIFEKLNQEDTDMDDIINNNFYGSKKLREAMGEFVAKQVKFRTNSMDMNDAFVKMDKYIENMNKSINRNDAKGARDNWLKYQAQVDKFNKDYTTERDLSSPFGKFMFWYGNNLKALDATKSLLRKNGYDINALPEVAYMDRYGNIKDKAGKNDITIKPRELAYVLMTVGTGETAEAIIDNSKVDFLKNPSTGQAYTIGELSDKFSRDDYLELTDEQRRFLGVNANIPEFRAYIDYRPNLDRIENAIEGKVSATNKTIEDKNAEIANLTKQKDDAEREKEAAEQALKAEQRDKRITQEISLVPDAKSVNAKMMAKAATGLEISEETANFALPLLRELSKEGSDIAKQGAKVLDQLILTSSVGAGLNGPEMLQLDKKTVATLRKRYPKVADKVIGYVSKHKVSDATLKILQRGGKILSKAADIYGKFDVVLSTMQAADELFNISGNIQQNIENGEFYKNLTQPKLGRELIYAVHGDNADYIYNHILKDDLLPYYAFRLTKFGPVAVMNTLGATKNKKGDTVYSPKVENMATWKGTTNDGNINITRGLLGSILYNKTGKENKDTGMVVTSEDVLKGMNLSYLDPEKDKKVIEEIYRKPYLLPIAWDSDFKQLDNKERLKLLSALDAEYGEQQFKNYRYR